MTVLATLLFWTGCVGALFAAYLGLVCLLTAETGTVADKGRGGTEQADHRSFVHSRTSYAADRTHDRGGF